MYRYGNLGQLFTGWHNGGEGVVTGQMGIALKYEENQLLTEMANMNKYMIYRQQQLRLI